MLDMAMLTTDHPAIQAPVVMSGAPPHGRDDFEIAIICALPLEFSAVSLVFDHFWDKQGDRYGKAAGDTNSYRTGCVGKHDVVLALLPHMGKKNAAATVASLRSSYTRLRLALLVGICGGVPRTRSGDEILLGDVIISNAVIQYDFGRQYPDGFVRKDAVGDNLGKQNKDVRGLLALLEDDSVKEDLEERTAFFLDGLQETDSQCVVHSASRSADWRRCTVRSDPQTVSCGAAGLGHGVREQHPGV